MNQTLNRKAIQPKDLAGFIRSVLFLFTVHSISTFPFTLVFKIQEDLAGVVQQKIIMQEIANLQAGIGYTTNQFNDPSFSAPGNAASTNSTVNSSGADPSSAAQSTGGG